MEIISALFILYLLFLLLRRLGRFLYSGLFKRLWHLRWRDVSRKDVGRTIGALCFIALFEVVLPSTSLTGREALRERVIVYPPSPPKGAAMSLTIGQVAAMAPWLSPLSKSSAYLAARKQDLSASLRKTQRARRRWVSKFNEAKRHVATFKSNNPNWLGEEAKRKQINRLQKDANARWLQLYDRTKLLERLKLLAQENAEKIRQYNPTLKFPRFHSPVQLVSGREKVVPDVMLTGPVVNKFGSSLKHAIELLRGDQREQVKAVADYSCRLEIENDGAGQRKAKKVCDVLLPLLMKYDVTRAVCPPDGRRRVPPDVPALNVGAGCLERWSYPSLLVRLDNQGITFFPPKSGAHSSNLVDHENLPITEWWIEVSGRTYLLAGETQIAWRDFPVAQGTGSWNLIHRPRAHQIAPRWWRDFAYDTRYLGFPLHFLTSQEYERQHRFSGADVPVGSKNILMDAALFVQDAKALGYGSRFRRDRFLGGYVEDLYAIYASQREGACLAQEDWSRALYQILGKNTQLPLFLPSRQRLKELRKRSALAKVRRPRIEAYVKMNGRIDCKQVEATFYFLAEFLARSHIRI